MRHAETSGSGPAQPPPPGPATPVAQALLANVTSVLLDKVAACRLAVAALLAGGHVLVEDVPGVGKTLLAKALARSVGGTFGRVQGTADLLPSDITGVTALDGPAGTWVFRPGPVFANVLLVDELNRATPRAQSALLEAMAEHHVTVDGVVHPLPDPFWVVATQNPLGDHGTFPLVEGQLDRFSVSLSLGLPGRDAERAVLLGDGGEGRLARLAAVVEPAGLQAARQAVASVHVATPIADYVLDLADATRAHPDVALGASTRACQQLVAVARGLAVLAGRAWVAPEDVQVGAPAVLAHRLVLRSPSGRAAVRRVVDDVIGRVPSPVP